MVSSLHQNTQNPTLENRLTFVLTLALSDTGRDDQDLERFRLLLDTFDRFFDKRFLEQFIIVTPRHDEASIRKALGTRIDTANISILDENDVCPEFYRDPVTTSTWPNPNKGWYKQQLIKLAIGKHVRTNFYMTLDSDVLFVTDFDTHSLIRNGKATLNVQTEEDFRNLYREDVVSKTVKIRQSRYKQVEPILRCGRKNGYLNQWYGETPVLLNRQLVKLLTSHIQQTWEKPWRDALLDNLPWTEYALYFLFAEDQGVLEDYYVPGNADSVLRLTESLWQSAAEYKIPRDLSNWDLDNIFNSNGNGVAVVVQSYLGYPVADIAKKIKPYI